MTPRNNSIGFRLSAESSKLRPRARSIFIPNTFMKKSFLNSIFCCLVIYLFTGSLQAQNPLVKASTDLKFEVGQIWSYKTRPNEVKSTFIVVKIDNDSKYGNIVHISVRDLRMKNSRSSDGFSDKINHMPFAEKAIAQSALKLLKERVELPDFRYGYDLWRQAFDEQRAGFYTITIAEAVGVVEEGLN